MLESTPLSRCPRSLGRFSRRVEAEGARQSLVTAVDGVILQMDEFVRDLPQTDAGRKRVYERAVKLSEGLRQMEADNPGLRRSVARVHLSLAEIATMVEDFRAAEQALDRAEPGIREWAAEAPDDPAVQGKLVSMIRAQWFTADRRGDRSRGLTLAREVERMATDLAVRFPDHIHFKNWKANALLAVANAEAAADPPPAACMDRYREALSILRALEPRVKKENPEIRFERAATYVYFGDYLRAAGKPAEAVDAYQESIALLADVKWYPTPRPHHRFHHATALRRWGGVLLELGEADRATDLLDQAADLFRELVANSPRTGDYSDFRLDALAERALARWAAGWHDDARVDAEEVGKLPTQGRRRLWRAKGLWVLGESARLKKDATKAREHFTEALAGKDDKALGADAREWKGVEALINLSLGDLARDTGDPTTAARHYRAADEVLAKLTESHPELLRYDQLRQEVATRLAAPVRR